MSTLNTTRLYEYISDPINNCISVRQYAYIGLTLTILYTIFDKDIRNLKTFLFNIMFLVLCIAFLSVMCKFLPTFTFYVAASITIFMIFNLYNKIGCISRTLV
jgi:hypothetical protein